MIVATTGRLTLRHLRPEDAAPLLAVFGDAEVMRFGDGPQPAAYVEAWVRRAIDEHYPAQGFGPYAVVERASGALLGYCGLFAFPDVGGRPEIELGYRLARAAWGRGYATEAAAAARDHAFATLGLARLIALIDPANTRSVAVAQKIGMRYEREAMLEGYTHPDHVYAIEQKGR